METDKKRIGLGNVKFPKITEEENAVLIPEFTFDSEEVTFDSILNTFDEE